MLIEVMHVASAAIGYMTRAETQHGRTFGWVQMPHTEARWIDLQMLVVSPWTREEDRALSQLVE